MKKFISLFCVLLLGLSVQAEVVELVTNVNMSNFWDKQGKKEEKIIDVASRIINANKFPYRINVVMDKTPKVINAYAYFADKRVHISEGILPYMNSDDELAAIISHEMAHVTDFYNGLGRMLAMKFNSKSFEHKADLVGIDYMVKAGYNPLAMITVGNKIFGESYWDYGQNVSHAKGSKRLLKEYEYIYVKYPQYLNSDFAQNIHYINWKTSASKEIKEFHLEQKSRNAQKGDL